MDSNKSGLFPLSSRTQLYLDAIAKEIYFNFSFLPKYLIASKMGALEMIEV